MNLENLSVLYSLLPPELLGPNKLFSPKGVMTDKGLSGNDLKAKWTMSILKSRNFSLQGRGLLPVGKQAWKDPHLGSPFSQSRTSLPLSGSGHPPWDRIEKRPVATIPEVKR